MVRTSTAGDFSTYTLTLVASALNSSPPPNFDPRLSSVDSGGTEQKVDSTENEIKQGSSHGADAARIAETGGAGAAIGGLATRTWSGAGIGAGAGGAVGLATVLLTRGKEVDLRRGSTMDVVFDRAVPME